MQRRRVYDAIFEHHLEKYRQMVFVTGPRQVGKTTSCRNVGTSYQSWEDTEVQRSIFKGTDALAHRLELDLARAGIPVVVFDELHKYGRWKAVLKGLYDLYSDRCKIVVTGSSRMDVYRRGGDSLMGRYFLYHMHPFSVAECLDTSLPTMLTRPPREISDEDWDALWKYGGFPEPFLKREDTFCRRWSSLREHQLAKEDIREVSFVQSLAQIGALVRILGERSSMQLVYASLAQEIASAPITVKGWVELLESLHFGFTVRPWYAKVANSLRKEPKWFLRDWSAVQDQGQRAETFVACHLLKACQGWTDLGMGRFELHYVRTKLKKEVDFLVSRDGQPWMLIEVKMSEKTLSRPLVDFQEGLRVPHAFQVVIDLPYENVDCFGCNRPVVVPARTFLSQLL